jgi:hypothetical protein
VQILCGREYFLDPTVVEGIYNEDPKAELLTLHSDSFGIVHVKVDPKRRGILGGPMCKPVAREGGSVSLAIDYAVDSQAMEQKPAAYRRGRAE